MPAGSIQIWTADAVRILAAGAVKQTGMKRRSNSRYAERGFTLTELLIATAIILVGLVAVAQLVPASVMLNSNNRNDATALVLAQRQLEAMREVPLNAYYLYGSARSFVPAQRRLATWEIPRSRGRSSEAPSFPTATTRQ